MLTRDNVDDSGQEIEKIFALPKDTLQGLYKAINSVYIRYTIYKSMGVKLFYDNVGRHAFDSRSGFLHIMMLF